MSLIRHKFKLFFIALAILFSFTLWLISESSNALRTNSKDLIRKELIRIDPQPSTNIVDAIYILGGSQCSLKSKFKTAAELYHKGITKKIMILSRPGITEYSSLIGRNLTNDEWAILKLEKLGILKENVEPIHIKEGFFGTLREAKGISRLIEERGYKSAILISSPHHTHRVRISFRNFLKDHNVTFYIQGSDRRASLTELIVEFIKLKIYEYFLV